MDIEIRKLTPELASDFFEFFDNRAFTDDSPYRCYCQVYQMTKERYQAAYDKAGEKTSVASLVKRLHGKLKAESCKAIWHTLMGNQSGGVMPTTDQFTQLNRYMMCLFMLLLKSTKKR